MKGVHYIDGFGQEIDAPLMAEFTDEDGVQWVVTCGNNGMYASHHFQVIRRQQVCIAEYTTDHSMKAPFFVGSEYPQL